MLAVFPSSSADLLFPIEIIGGSMDEIWATPVHRIFSFIVGRGGH